MNDGWPVMPGDLQLAAGCVDLFLVATETISPEALARCAALLAAEERERIGRLRSAAKRAEAIISRGALRQLLGHLLKIAPDKVALSAGEWGKPFVVDSALHFNVSHTSAVGAGRVFIGVSRDLQLGLDVEAIDASVKCEELAQRFFCAAESAAILALPKENRALAFFRCWTRKEALMKATGDGITTGLNAIEVPIGALDEAVNVGRWRLRDMSMDAGFVGALAVGGRDVILRRWRANL